MVNNEIKFDDSFNKLPTIIDEPGTYLTRNNKIVEIHEIKEYDKKICTMFNCKGTYKKNKHYTYNIWHDSGRFLILNEDNIDIIKKIKGVNN